MPETPEIKPAEASKNHSVVKAKILCMFSGGLDSLGALYRLLTAPEYRDKKIHVHHLILKNIENRALAEQAACKNILNYFRANDYPEFEYTESLHDVSFLRHYFIYDSVMYGFIGANMMINDKSIVAMAIGSNGDDRKDLSTILRANKGRDVYHALLPDQMRYQRPYIYPVVHMSKKQIWDMLPKDLRKLAWSCRKPVYENNRVLACGKCKTCHEVKKLMLAERQAQQNHSL